MEAAKGIGIFILWIAVLYGAYKILDVTGLGNLIADFLEWFDTSPRNQCGVCDPPVNF